MKKIICAIATLTSSATLASTHDAHCEVYEGEALAWVAARGHDIDVTAKAVLKVYDRQGDMIYKKSKQKSFAVDAFDSHKVYEKQIGREASWCELQLKRAEIAVHEEPVQHTVVYHHYPQPPAPVMIYRSPRQERVIVHRQSPTRVYTQRRHVRSERVIVKPQSQSTRVRVSLPTIRVRL